MEPAQPAGFVVTKFTLLFALAFLLVISVLLHCQDSLSLSETGSAAEQSGCELPWC
jgi:hypothetical protein